VRKYWSSKRSRSFCRLLALFTIRIRIGSRYRQLVIGASSLCWFCWFCCRWPGTRRPIPTRVFKALGILPGLSQVGLQTIVGVVVLVSVHPVPAGPNLGEEILFFYMKDHKQLWVTVARNNLADDGIHLNIQGQNATNYLAWSYWLNICFWQLHR